MTSFIALPRYPSHPLLLPRLTFLHARYVEQFDTLLGILTVYEMLMYTGEAVHYHRGLGFGKQGGDE